LRWFPAGENLAIPLNTESPREKPLAGIDQRSAAVGVGAADVVIERINNNDLGVPSRARTIVLPGDWIAGATVRPAARTGSPLRKGRKPLKAMPADRAQP
jgi:hypothetical protein